MVEDRKKSILIDREALAKIEEAKAKIESEKRIVEQFEKNPKSTRIKKKK